jgi:hypothetical protein
MGVDKSLPGALAWQRWLGLRRGRRGRCQVTRWPGGLVRCWPAGGDAWDASQAAANLWWIHLVLSLFQVADRPTQPVGPGPLSQPRRRAVGARSRQGTTDRPGRAQQQDHHQHAHAAHSETTPTRPGRLVLWRSPTLRRVFDSQVSSCSQYPFLLPKPTSCNRRRNKNASGAPLREREPLATATCGRMGNQNRPAIPLSRRSTGRIVTDKA